MDCPEEEGILEDKAPIPTHTLYQSASPENPGPTTSGSLFSLFLESPPIVFQGTLLGHPCPQSCQWPQQSNELWMVPVSTSSNLGDVSLRIRPFYKCQTE